MEWSALKTHWVLPPSFIKITLRARDRFQVLPTLVECGENKRTTTRELELKAKTILLLIRLTPIIKVTQERKSKNQTDHSKSSLSTSYTCCKELETSVSREVKEVFSGSRDSSRLSTLITVEHLNTKNSERLFQISSLILRSKTFSLFSLALMLMVMEFWI